MFVSLDSASSSSIATHFTMSTYADAPENPPETIRGIDLIPPWGDSPESMSYWHKDPMTGLYVSGPDS